MQPARMASSFLLDSGVLLGASPASSVEGDDSFPCTSHPDHNVGEARLSNLCCDTCSLPPFRDTYDPPAELPRCDCGGRILPDICWFGEVPFELDRIFRLVEECTIFMAVGTSGVVEPAASFVAHVGGRAPTIYVGREEPANVTAFSECHLGNAGEVLPDLLGLGCVS